MVSSYFSQFPYPCFQIFRCSHAKSFSHSSNVSQTALSPEPALPPVSSQTSLSFLYPTSLASTRLLSTPAKTSRATAEAIRISLKNENIGDAYTIVNSLRYGYHGKNASQKTLFPDSLRSLANFKADVIPFSQDVSPRLALHTFLHGLLRKGLITKAANVSQQMMEDGIKVHSKTLEMVIQKVARTRIGKVGKSKSTINLLGEATLSPLSSRMSNRGGTQHAIHLLTLARQYRNRRTNAMFATIVALCILNGEIILASLIYVWAVKDWQKRESLISQMPIEDESPIPPQKQALRLRRDQLRMDDIFPSRKLLNDVLRSVDEKLAKDDKDDDFRAGLQALANLAVLLDRRLIPFSEIAPLIRSLYNCPRVEDKVWILDKFGQRQRTTAYVYFHHALKGLINNLPTLPVKLDPSVTYPSSSTVNFRKKYDLLPPLDIHGYNALLHYALRHRFSPALAGKILEHMTIHRFEPLEPDVATINILLRSGTLLRRNDIARKALETLRLHQPISQVNKQLPEQYMPLPNEALVAATSEPFQSLALDSISTPLTADNVTLSSFLNHLTATGEKQIIVNMAFRILPSDSRQLEVSTYTLERWRVEDRDTKLKKAVSLGPYVFSSLLNALSKAGKTGLAEKVWYWAKEAERASWDPEFCPKVKPWCLPIHAYTSMIQCYGNEARQRPSRQRIFHAQARELREGQHVVGWGREFPDWQTIGALRLDRSTTGRHIAFSFYKSLADCACNIYGTYRDVQDKSLKPLRPDARLFNALLKIFTCHSLLMKRTVQKKRKHWTLRLRSATEAHAFRGVVSPKWTPELGKIGQDMVNAGFPIPPALRHIFVGRCYDGTMKSNSPSPMLDRRPFAFTNKTPWAARNLYYLPTYKSRGLPIRRKRRKLPCRRRRSNVY